MKIEISQKIDFQKNFKTINFSKEKSNLEYFISKRKKSTFMYKCFILLKNKKNKEGVKLLDSLKTAYALYYYF